MKRLILLIYFGAFGLVVALAQSGTIIDDIYITPNEAQMVKEVQKARAEKERMVKTPTSSISRNGAREIVFIDEDGNQTTVISDTIYIVDGEIIVDSLLVTDEESEEDGYYLNGFKGSQSDYEYAERIRRFHNPRYTITIADPGYDDIYFLDDNYWNVHIDGVYATITPTWNNPYWWDYKYSSFGYNSWAWRYNWGYPYSYYSGWGYPYSYYGWGYPYYDYWYNPWYSGYYGYYGWGYYPYDYYYGGYYGWYSPYYYYGGYYSPSYYNSNNDEANRRRSLSAGRYTSTGLRSHPSRRSAVMSGSSGRSDVSGTRITTNRSGVDATRSTRSGVTTGSTTRSVTGNVRSASSVDTRTRTGTVRSAAEWQNLRNSNDGVRSSSSVINRTERSSGSYNAGRSAADYSRSRSANTRSYDSSRSRSYDSGSSRPNVFDMGRSSSSSSSGSYSSPSRSSSSSSSGSYSSPSRSSSGGGGSYGGGSSSGGGRSSSSSSSGGRR